MCSIALPTQSIIIVRNSVEKKTVPDDQDTKGWKGGYRDAWKFIASRRNTATWVSWMKSLLVMQYTKALKTWNEPPHYGVVGKPPTSYAEIRCKTWNNHNVDPHDQLLVVKVWLWWFMVSLWHSNPDRLVGMTLPHSLVFDSKTKCCILILLLSFLYYQLMFTWQWANFDWLKICAFRCSAQKEPPT